MIRLVRIGVSCVKNRLKIMKQKTLAGEVILRGVGLHTGQTITVTICPADINFGFKFQRVDLDGKPIVAADATKVADTKRGTILKQGNAEVRTCEHLLSALVGLEIDNALIQLDGAEVPILDGSALPFVQAIANIGIVEQNAKREDFVITESLHWKDEQTGSEYWALPCEQYQVTTLIDFQVGVLGQQFAELDNLQQYAHEIAPARTFVFVKELEMLFDAGLIQGGDLDNALVIAEKQYEASELDRLATKFGKPSVKDAKIGYLNTSEPRFNNEPARHKLLDVIGDLALVGKPMKAKIIATKPGHASNTAFAKFLKKHHAEWLKLKDVPRYNPNDKPIMDINEVSRRLPHRFPFLLVDKVIEMSPNHIVGLKNVTINDPFFQGHFPENPVMPGVLQVEAMAQTGGILALQSAPADEIWDTYFLKIENCKFREKVLPGDTLLFKLELMEPIRRGIVKMRGVTYSGNKITSEAELTAMIQKRG